MATTAYLTGTFYKAGPIWILTDVRVYSEETPTQIGGKWGTPYYVVFESATAHDFESARKALKAKVQAKWGLMELLDHLMTKESDEIARFVNSVQGVAAGISGLFRLLE